MRVGIYTDAVYRRQGSTVSTSTAYVEFLAELRHHVDSLTLFGRVHPEAARAASVLPEGLLRFVPLPWYPSLWHPVALSGAVAGTRRAMAAEIGNLDALWVFGPHPLGQILARDAYRRGLAVVLGVRQDFIPYVAHRTPPPVRWMAVGAARVLLADFDRLARRMPVVAVSETLAARYRGSSPEVEVAYPSLVRARDLADGLAGTDRRWPGAREILAVTRLEPEKNPVLLADVLAGVHRELGEGWSMTVAGTGSMGAALEARAAQLGAHQMTLLGHVPHGEPLRALYRRATVLVHTSWTEGAPQVLFEAGAAGLPVVATDVGAVPEVLAGGRAGLLVPPGDPEAVVDAIGRLGRDGLAQKVGAALHEVARGHTLEAEVARAAALLTRWPAGGKG